MSNLATMSDYELVSLYEQGKDEAFDILLSRNQECVFGYIMQIVGDVEMANDIFQDTFAKAVVSIRSHQYRNTGKFCAWLQRIAHNIAVDGRRSARILPSVSEDEMLTSLYNNPKLSQECCEDMYVLQGKLGTVHTLINQLPDAQREIIRLRFFEDLSFKEIAAMTGVSINTALGRMRYALINLRKIIQERELDIAV